MSDSKNNNNNNNNIDFNNINPINFNNIAPPNLEQFNNFKQHTSFLQNQEQQQQHHYQQQKNNSSNNNPYGNKNQQIQNYNNNRQNNNNNNNNKNNYYEYLKQNQAIATHYDKKQNVPVHIRSQSKIISLKNINNWVKSILIQEYSKPNSIVFDICGGKLGDLQKWIKAQIKSLIVSDISLESLKHGTDRYNNKLNYIHFDITMIAVDCFSPKLLESFPKIQNNNNNIKKKQKVKKQQNEEDESSDSDESESEVDDDSSSTNVPSLLKVNLVSCQFALHYSFRTEESARSLLKNVSEVLEDGGHFIGTIPNSCLIVKKLRESNSNKFGNQVYSIEFKEKEPKLNAFGCAYNFFLEDAIDFLEEYLVHIDVLIELAKDYQLEIVSHQSFHSFIYEKSEIKQHHDLLRKMSCFNSNNTISDAEWEALGIYKTFVFKKVGNNNNNNSNNNNNDRDKDTTNRNSNYNNYQAKKITDEDIIVNL